MNNNDILCYGVTIVGFTVVSALGMSIYGLQLIGGLMGLGLSTTLCVIDNRKWSKNK